VVLSTDCGALLDLDGKYRDGCGLLASNRDQRNTWKNAGHTETLVQIKALYAQAS